MLLLLDVDFMISSSLNELQHAGWLHSAVSQGMLVVLPALEPIKDDTAAQESVLRTCRGDTCLGLPQSCIVGQCNRNTGNVKVSMLLGVGMKACKGLSLLSYSKSGISYALQCLVWMQWQTTTRRSAKLCSVVKHV